MSNLNVIEKGLIVPAIISELREHPDGLTLEEIRHALTTKGIGKTRDRLLEICAVFCSARRSHDEIRYVPNGELYPVIIH